MSKRPTFPWGGVRPPGRKGSTTLAGISPAAALAAAPGALLLLGYLGALLRRPGWVRP